MKYHHPVRSFLRSSLNRIRYGKRLGPVFGDFQPADDYDWTQYTEDSYKHEMASAHHVRRLADVEWSVFGGRIKTPGDRPLHPMHRIIYETALELRPNSAFEAGCGGGDHLANLKLLMPELQIDGGDVSKEQLAFARQRNFSNISVSLRQLDLTKAGAADGIKAEFVYTNAVLMHIHGGDRPLEFVRNLWNISTRYLLFVENWSRHNYLKLFADAIGDKPPYKVEREGVVGILFAGESMNLPLVKNSSDLFLTRTE